MKIFFILIYYLMKFVPSESKHREDKQGYSKKIILDEKELNNP